MSEAQQEPVRASRLSAIGDGGHTRIIGAAAVVLVLAAIWAWYHYAGRVSTDDAQVEGHITPIAARVGGTVLEVAARENTAVKKGDVLVRIDPRDYEVALARVRGELADAEAAVAVAQAAVPIAETTTSSDVTRTHGSHEAAQAASVAAARDVDAARARLGAARARLAEAQANAVKVGKDRERLTPLLKKDEISQQQYDAAAAAADVANAAVDAARAVVTEAETGVAVAESRQAQARAGVSQAEAGMRAATTGPQQVTAARARLQAAEARVAQVRAALSQAELNLQYTTVVAPNDGVVSRKSVEPGQIVAPGQPLFAVVSLADLWVVANFKETQLAGIRPGQRVDVSVDALGESLPAKVDSVAAATGAKFSVLPPENASGNFVKVVQRIPVKILFEPNADPEGRLRPGMSVVPVVHLR